MLHNISITCPTICYLVPARLFVTGNKEVKCKEGTILWDTIAMGAYALGVTPLIHFLHEYILVNKQWCEEAAFADDSSDAGKSKNIKTYWEMLQKLVNFMDIWVKVFKNGPSKICGRQPLKNLNPYLKPSKSYLIVKEKHLGNAVESFRGKKSNLQKKLKDISK